MLVGEYSSIAAVTFDLSGRSRLAAQGNMGPTWSGQPVEVRSMEALGLYLGTVGTSLHFGNSDDDVCDKRKDEEDK